MQRGATTSRRTIDFAPMPDARVALVTCDRFPLLPPDEWLLIDALAGLGMRAEAAVWSDPAVRWVDYDRVVIRSAWDYHLHRDAFFRWVEAVTAAGIPIWNPPALLRWNAEKTYLRDLASRGINVVPTRYLRAGDEASLAALLEDEGWDRAIVKPTVSASAFSTWRVDRADAAAHEARFQALSAERGVMVQPYLDTIEREGEWSLIFIGGVFSHAMLKRPARGDFRVQEEHGGSATAHHPPAGVVEDARRALAAVEGPWLYARVDGCAAGKGLQLLELEMLEPTLYLDAAPTAPARLAAAIVESHTP